MLMIPLVHVDAYAQQEGEEQLVLLKERAAHVAVQAVGEVVVDVEDTLRDVVRPFGVGDAAEEDADEPLEGVLVHGVDGGHVGHAEEEDLGVDGPQGCTDCESRQCPSPVCSATSTLACASTNTQGG